MAGRSSLRDARLRPKSKGLNSKGSHMRRTGRYSLHLVAPPSVGLPHGSYPRLVLAWLTTEAVRTKSPEIRLGPTFSERGTVVRLRDQLHRLFSTTIRWTYADEAAGHASGRGYVIAGEHQLWWSPRDSAQQPSWQSRVVLGNEFFEEITRSSVPVDLRLETAQLTVNREDRRYRQTLPAGRG